MIQNNPLHLSSTVQRIALVTHLHPDGDAYGSLLGLKSILSQFIPHVDAYADNELTSKFAFLPGYYELKGYRAEVNELYDVCIVLDCGNIERIDVFLPILKQSERVINIDHHVSNTEFGDVNWVDPKASSTAEILTSLVKELCLTVNPDAATCLLTGIMMDTGSFIYDSTTSKTHLSAAFLRNHGANHDAIRYHLYQNRPLQNVRFLGYLIDHMELIENNQVVILMVSDDLLQQFQVAYEDLDEFISYVRDISGVELAIILKETTSSEVKVSFRSKKWLNVNRLASYFNGGGHERAAGASMEGTLLEVRNRIMPLVNQCFHGGQTI